MNCMRMKPTIKNAQSMHCIIPLEPRRQLERTARQHGVTMSWIVRSLIRQYRRKNPNPPRRKRPKKLIGKHVRFCLKVYGEKTELQAWARSGGGEFSVILREILELWMEGLLKPNLGTSKSVKTVKKFFISFTGVASAIPVPLIYNFPADFWPKNPEGNLRIMELGLRNRKTPLSGKQA